MGVRHRKPLERLHFAVSSINHPRGGHDDVANCVAGAVTKAAQQPAGWRRRDAVIPTLTVERPRVTYSGGYPEPSTSCMYRR
jgi:hypothetical protein